MKKTSTKKHLKRTAILASLIFGSLLLTACKQKFTRDVTYEEVAKVIDDYLDDQLGGDYFSIEVLENKEFSLKFGEELTIETKQFKKDLSKTAESVEADSEGYYDLLSLRKASSSSSSSSEYVKDLTYNDLQSNSDSATVMVDGKDVTFDESFLDADDKDKILQNIQEKRSLLTQKVEELGGVVDEIDRNIIKEKVYNDYKDDFDENNFDTFMNSFNLTEKKNNIKDQADKLGDISIPATVAKVSGTVIINQEASNFSSVSGISLKISDLNSEDLPEVPQGSDEVYVISGVKKIMRNGRTALDFTGTNANIKIDFDTDIDVSSYYRGGIIANKNHNLELTFSKGSLNDENEIYFKDFDGKGKDEVSIFDAISFLEESKLPNINKLEIMDNNEGVENIYGTGMSTPF